MSIARKDDRHNEDLVKEIADSFNRVVGPRPTEDAEGGEQEAEPPRFRVTGDQRAESKPRPRRSR